MLREKRKHQRTALSTPVTITAPDGTSWVSQSRDISMGGVFLHGAALARIGTVVTLAFELPQGSLEVPAFVRWSTPEGFGLQFGLLGVRETHALGAFIRAHAEPRSHQ